MKFEINTIENSPGLGHVISINGSSIETATCDDGEGRNFSEADRVGVSISPIVDAQI